ncbi:sigma-70 domain-containing protein [Streptomyces decoyicus]|uniref:sigma-70 domain-containing protein n=1 Tax=Streptomyces decoyicus TaxID=249567 RepID=UPI00362B2B1B
MRVPRRLQELRIDVARAREEPEGQGNHEPSAAELAEHLDMAEDEVAEGLVAWNGYDSDSLDRPIQAGGGGKQQTGFVADLIGTEDPPSPWPKTSRPSSRTWPTSTTRPHPPPAALQRRNDPGQKSATPHSQMHVPPADPHLQQAARTTPRHSVKLAAASTSPGSTPPDSAALGLSSCCALAWLPRGAAVAVAGAQDQSKRERLYEIGAVMVVLGIILLVIGFVTGIAILWTIGIVLVAIGAILWLLGAMGHAVAGPKHYW